MDQGMCFGKEKVQEEGWMDGWMDEMLSVNKAVRILLRSRVM